jgi:hypothetical protein
LCFRIIKFAKNLKGDFPWATKIVLAPDEKWRTDVGVSGVYVNFCGAVLFLFIAQMYLRSG